MAGDAVDGPVDQPDLVIGQVKVGREPVAGDRIGLVETAGRNRVRKIDPEQIMLPEHGVVIHAPPVSDMAAVADSITGSGFAVFAFAFSNMVVIDASIGIQKVGKLQRIQGRRIAGGTGIHFRCIRCSHCVRRSPRVRCSPAAIHSF